MIRRQFPKNVHLLLVAMLLGIWMLWMPKAFNAASSDAATPHRVHIAFGFHANLYHSFRGDTNDENGFGQDIRVIRHTIEALDRFNRQGIDVHAVWDFDSLFSLQEILPVYAPDIIKDVRRRVRDNGDDVILMSYNNGMMSAMTDREFMTSMERAISNDKGSGVRDLFGRVAPVVRPQEMMTTPGNFKRYRQLGIDAVSLYYSATPFDGFRMFSRPLSPAEAHNPITYRNPDSGESITILPTYHAGDLVENVSLRHWAQRLHQLQAEGAIDRDVLIFINFDADAEFWTGAQLPAALKWLPNTGGIAQLVESVADLSFVTFSNISDYLADHGPAGTVSFNQDTADGSFNGYNSWAEKASTSDYWTRIERNRNAHRKARRILAIAKDSPVPPALGDLLYGAFELRLRALSTTNFGLATPFLSRPREKVMDALMTRLDWYTDQIDTQVDTLADQLIDRVIHQAETGAAMVPPGRVVDTFVHLESAGGGDRLLTFGVPASTDAPGDYVIAAPNGRRIAARIEKREATANDHARITLRIDGAAAMPDGVYWLCRAEPVGHPPASAVHSVHADARQLFNDVLRIDIDDRGHVAGVSRNGVRQLGTGSLIPSMVYHGERLQPERLTVTVTADGSRGVGEVRLHGPWPGPPGVTRSPGWVDYRLRLVENIPFLFVDGTLRYPDTRRTSVLQADKPMLARKIDDGWQSVAPIELRFTPTASTSHPFVIQKRNYLDQKSSYPVDYYRHAPENRNVANINNHITAAYAGVTTNGRGMAVAMNTAVQANFAFCPFQMAHHPETGAFTLRANPFGTYSGNQLLPPTRGNRLGYEAVLLSAPQLQSAAPTYNGTTDRFELMVAFFEADAIPHAIGDDLVAFARRPLTIASHRTSSAAPPEPPDLAPAGLLVLPDQGAMVFHWDTPASPVTRYRLQLKSLTGDWEKIETTTSRTLRVAAAEFPDGQTFQATVQSLTSNGRLSPASEAIRFRPGPPEDKGLDIPPRFMARVLWTQVSTWVRQNLL